MHAILLLDPSGESPVAGALATLGTVHRVTDLREAVAACAVARFDLAVVFHRPGALDGAQACETLRAECPGLEALVVYPMGQVPIETAGPGSVGGVFFMASPFVPDQLVRACQRTLRLAPRIRAMVAGKLGIACGSVRMGPLTEPPPMRSMLN